jgi:hypothetical protein
MRSTTSVSHTREPLEDMFKTALHDIIVDLFQSLFDEIANGPLEYIGHLGIASLAARDLVLPVLKPRLIWERDPSGVQVVLRQNPVGYDMLVVECDAVRVGTTDKANIFARNAVHEPADAEEQHLPGRINDINVVPRQELFLGHPSVNLSRQSGG